MKNLSLAFLAIGLASTFVAFKALKKTKVDGALVKEASHLVYEATTAVKDTTWVTVYRTKYVYKCAVRKTPDATFLDTSALSIPRDLMGTKFQDTLSNIALEDYIKPPKAFVFQDSNIYLAATVLATGITIDSLSVPAKLAFKSTWRKNTAEIGIMSANPYVTGVGPLVFYTKKPCLFRQ